MKLLIEIIGCTSALLAFIGVIGYISHPLYGTKLITYTGHKFWAVAFICAALIYLKG